MIRSARHTRVEGGGCLVGRARALRNLEQGFLDGAAFGRAVGDGLDLVAEETCFVSDAYQVCGREFAALAARGERRQTNDSGAPLVRCLRGASSQSLR